MLEQRTRKLALALGAILSLFFLLHFFKILSPLENGFVFLTKPLLRGLQGGTRWINQNYFSWRSAAELRQENEKLKTELSFFWQEKVKFLLAEEENDFLRQQLNLAEKRKISGQVATVIGQSADQTQNAIILDRGRADDVNEGQAVVVGDGVLIGKIIKVRQTQSFALLINDDLSEVAATVLNNDKTIGVVEGEYGLGLRLRMVPQTEVIKEGDLVVTSGLETGIPRGLLIGVVRKVQQEPESLFQEAVIESPVDLEKIFLVNIIQNNVVAD